MAIQHSRLNQYRDNTTLECAKLTVFLDCIGVVLDDFLSVRQDCLVFMVVLESFDHT